MEPLLQLVKMDCPAKNACPGKIMFDRTMCPAPAQ